MVINILIAGLAGVMVPVMLDRLDQDPAVAQQRVRDDDHRFDGFLRLPLARGAAGWPASLQRNRRCFASPGLSAAPGTYLASHAAQHDQDRLSLAEPRHPARVGRGGERGAYAHALSAQAPRRDGRRLAVLDPRPRDRRPLAKSSASSNAPDGRWTIRLEPRLVPVHPGAKRAHQGWRYLEERKAPRDLAEGEVAGDAIPARLAGRLTKLGLI